LEGSVQWLGGRCKQDIRKWHCLGLAKSFFRGQKKYFMFGIVDERGTAEPKEVYRDRPNDSRPSVIGLKTIDQNIGFFLVSQAVVINLF
jgi:hypothetical protein